MARGGRFGCLLRLERGYRAKSCRRHARGVMCRRRAAGKRQAWSWSWRRGRHSRDAGQKMSSRKARSHPFSPARGLQVLPGGARAGEGHDAHPAGRCPRRKCGDASQSIGTDQTKLAYAARSHQPCTAENRHHAPAPTGISVPTWQAAVTWHGKLSPARRPTSPPLRRHKHSHAGAPFKAATCGA